MKITYQLTPRDFQGTFLTNRVFKLFYWAVVLFICFMLLVLLISLMSGRREQVLGALPFMCVVSAWALIMYLIPRWSIRRQFLTNPTLQSSVSAEFSDEGMSMESTHESSHLSWSAFHK